MNDEWQKQCARRQKNYTVKPKRPSPPKLSPSRARLTHIHTRTHARTHAHTHTHTHTSPPKKPAHTYKLKQSMFGFCFIKKSGLCAQNHRANILVTGSILPHKLCRSSTRTQTVRSCQALVICSSSVHQLTVAAPHTHRREISRLPASCPAVCF